MNKYMNTSICKNIKGLVATFPCSQGPPAQVSRDAEGTHPFPLPPWDESSGPQLQGNAATNPFLSLRIFIFIH